jgi:hypothetical protein
MAGLDEEHSSSVAVITLDPNAINSIIRMNCIVLSTSIVASFLRKMFV